jgi:hypothetical protein
MSGPAPPLRFLAIVLGGWIAVRAVTLMSWQNPPAVAEPRRELREAAIQAAEAARPTPATAEFAIATGISDIRAATPSAAPAAASSYAADDRCCGSGAPLALPLSPAPALTSPPMSLSSPRPGTPPVLPAPGASTSADRSRWSASAWLLVRRDAVTPTLAPGGSLGGSQAGARLLYRLGGDNGPFIRLGGRIYAPLRRAAGAEAAVGIDWQPVRRLPLFLLAERRQALGDEGRSAFSLTLYGGASADLPLGIRLDGYAQTGVVGLRSRDPFVDAAVQLRRPVGPVEIGAGAWGAAQPGAARLDVGPQISVRLPARRANLRLSADWRVRIAGNAAPGSGPALTLGADF